MWHIQLWPYAWFTEAYNANISFWQLGLWHSMNNHTSWLGSFNIRFLFWAFSDLGFRWWRKPQTSNWSSLERSEVLGCYKQSPANNSCRRGLTSCHMSHQNALFYYAHAFAYVITLSFVCPITNRKRAWSCKLSTVMKRHAEMLGCTVVSLR